MKPSLGFFGSPIHSANLLQMFLAAGLEVRYVVTNPPKPFGRKQILTPTPVEILARESNIPVFSSPHLKKDTALWAELARVPVDFHVVYAYGSILPQEVYSLPHFGSYNLHGSILPELRGASPVQTAILQGRTLSGFSIQAVAPAIDSGEVFAKEEIPISPEDTTESYLQKITERGGEAFLTLLSKPRDQWKGILQNDAEASFCKKIQPEDRKISFQKKAVEIHNQVRALYPDPTAYAFFRKKRILLHRTLFPTPFSPEKSEPGQLFPTKEKKLFCASGDGQCFEILVLQAEGKSKMETKAFLNGLNLNEGEVLE